MSFFYTKFVSQSKRVPPEDDTLVILSYFAPLKLYKKRVFKACEARKAQFTISK